METRNLKHSILFAMVLPFIIVFVSSLAFYFGNHMEYAATLTDTLPLLLSISAIITVLLFILLLSVHRWPTLHSTIAGTLVGLALSAWIQSQIFAWDFGPLDGRGVDWSRWHIHANAEWAIWSTIVGLSIAWAIRSPKTFRTVAQGAFLLGALTLTTSWLSSDYEPKKQVDLEKGANLSEDTIFSLHKTRNTILIVLDTFQSDVFHEIMQRYPEEAAFLRGFTFFPNAMGGYPTTFASIPLIMTGKFYTNETPIRSWLKTHNAAHNMTGSFIARGYGVSLASVADTSLIGTPAKIIRLEAISQYEQNRINKLGLLVLDGGLFRVLPTKIKPIFYDEGNWFFSRLALRDKLPPGKNGDDLRFLGAFEKYAKIRSDNVGEFKLYHYFGTHPPLQTNEHFEYEQNMPKTRATHIRQARGVLTLLRRKIEKLKRLGIYDAAQILVVADHGSGSLFPSDMQGKESEIEDGVDVRVFSSARPLFLYKPSNSPASLTSSDAPVHLADIVCLLKNDKSDINCDEDLAWQEDNIRKRKFFHYDWTKDYKNWRKDYLPPMTEYAVTGDIRNFNAWHRTDREYAEGAVRKLQKIIPYNFGDRIDFSKAGNSRRFKIHGWSGQELNHCWTEGDSASLRISIPDISEADGLVLRLDASGILNQNVDVYVNSKKVATWQVLNRDWHEALIPEAVLGEGKLHIAFGISNPTAPCKIYDSNDCRELGIAVRELVITTQAAKS
jgi:hypothetical protein